MLNSYSIQKKLFGDDDEKTKLCSEEVKRLKELLSGS
jgi:hypothetical protein